MAWIRWHTGKDGRRWAHLQGRDASGRKWSRALRTTDARVAATYLKAEDGAIDSGAPAALRRFLAQRSVEKSAATATLDRRNLTPLFAAWADRPMPQWAQADLVTYIGAKTWKPRTVQLLASSCRAFVAWAHRSSVPCPDFMAGFRPPPVRKSEAKHLEPEEVDRLLLAVRPHRTLEVPVGLAALAGLRRGELLGLDAADLRWKRKEILVRATKRHTDRIVPMSGRLEEILRRRRVLSGPVVRLGPHLSNMRRSLVAACRRAKVPEVSWHPLRHSFATGLILKGADLATVAALMGHKDPALTLRLYIHTIQRRQRDAVQRFL